MMRDARLSRLPADGAQEMTSGDGRVVVGVDGSRSSLAALRRATEIARSKHWSIDIVTAWPDADEVFVHDVPGRYIVPRGQAMRVLQQAVDVVAEVPDVAISTFLVNARPTRALMSRCAGADLLVVGAGRPAAERDRATVGSECLATASCPVVVVRGPGSASAVSTPVPALPRHMPSVRLPA